MNDPEAAQEQEPVGLASEIEPVLRIGHLLTLPNVSTALLPRIQPVQKLVGDWPAIIMDSETREAFDLREIVKQGEIMLQHLSGI